MNNQQKIITTRTASSLSTFELRQELVRRGALDIPENQINYKSMLARLMRELVQEESQAMESRIEIVIDKAKESREAAKLLREQKKLEAIERSRARQSDPSYFQSRIDANEKKIPVIEETKQVMLEELETSSSQIIESEPDQDIFLSSKPSRNKIFIR